MISPAVTIAQDTRQGGVEGAAIPIPPTAANVVAQSTMDSVDILAGPPGQRTVTLGLQWSYDQGRTWTPPDLQVWESGPGDVGEDGTTPAPPLLGASVPTNPVMPGHARAYLSLEAQTFIGVDLIFTDATGATL